MAKRTGTIEHDKLTREKIQVSQLINVLQKHALGETEMGMSRIQAAKILLSKTLPDLQATQLTGAENGPLTVQIIKFADTTPP